MFQTETHSSSHQSSLVARHIVRLTVMLLYQNNETSNSLNYSQRKFNLLICLPAFRPFAFCFVFCPQPAQQNRSSLIKAKVTHCYINQLCVESQIKRGPATAQKEETSTMNKLFHLNPPETN